MGEPLKPVFQYLSQCANQMAAMTLRMPSLTHLTPHEQMTPDYQNINTCVPVLTNDSFFIGETTKKESAPVPFHPEQITKPILLDMQQLHATIQVEARQMNLEEELTGEKRDDNLTNMYLSNLQMLLEQYNIHTVIHTDGSVKVIDQDGQKVSHLGAAVYHSSGSSDNTCTYIKQPTWTSYAAELMAIYLAIARADPTKNTLICSDSLSAIQAIKVFPTKQTSRRLKKCFSWLLSLILDKIEDIQNPPNKGRLMFYKVPSHRGIYPNMQADAMAARATNPQNIPTLCPTTDIPLIAVAATLTHNNERLHRPAYKHIRSVVQQHIIQMLTSPQHNNRWLPPVCDQQYNIIGRQHSPLSKKLYNSKFTHPLISKFIEETTTERLKLPETSKTHMEDVDRCPLCKRRGTVNNFHYIFLCNATAEARKISVSNLTAVKDKRITDIHTDTINRLRHRWAAKQHTDPAQAQEIINYLLLGPPATHQIFNYDTNGNPKIQCPKELFKAHRNIAHAFQKTWRKNSEKIHRFYEKKKKQLAQQNSETAGENEPSDYGSDDQD